MSGYRRLDFDKLHFAETPVSYGDADKMQFLLMFQRA